MRHDARAENGQHTKGKLSTWGGAHDRFGLGLGLVTLSLEDRGGDTK